MFKKLLLSFILSVIALVSVFPSRTYAQAQPLAPWYNQSFPQWYVKVFDTTNPTEIFGERYSFAQVKWIAWSMAALVIEATTAKNENISRCVAGDVSGCQVSAQPITGSNLAQNGTKKTFWTTFFEEERPISLITYLRTVGRKISPVKEANAQVGVGYTALSPVQGLWTQSKNITYVLFVLIFVVTAFMIMFRVKLSPQTVISVQSALPRIFIALVLVTFSYAIAGFLVDMMYVVIGLIALLTNVSFDQLVNGVTFPVLGVQVSGIFGNVVAYLTLLTTSLASFNASSGLGFTLLTILILIVAIIAGIFITFKILWQLIRSLAIILILTFVAPLQIALGVLMPSVGFGSWFKNFISNLAVFPVTGLLFVLAYTFILQAITNMGIAAPAGGAAYPPLPETNIPGWPPLLNLGPGWENFLLIATSFVIYATTPKAAELIKNLIAGRPFAFGTAVGEAVAPAQAGGRTAGLYGIGRMVTRAEDIEYGKTGLTPTWTQVVRKGLGLRRQ